MGEINKQTKSWEGGGGVAPIFFIDGEPCVPPSMLLSSCNGIEDTIRLYKIESQLDGLVNYIINQETQHLKILADRGFIVASPIWRLDIQIDGLNLYEETSKESITLNGSHTSLSVPILKHLV